jgi:hypothetical protein
MPKQTVAIAAIVVAVLALLASIAVFVLFMVKKSNTRSSVASGTPQLTTNSTGRTIVSNYPVASACDETNPCTQEIIGTVCMPLSPGNSSKIPMICNETSDNSLAWQPLSSDPHSDPTYPSNGPIL